MAKPVKTTKPVKSTPVIAEAAPIKTRTRETVLVKLTAAQLHDLIGDAPIGVSRKDLLDIQMKQARSALSAKLG